MLPLKPTIENVFVLIVFWADNFDMNVKAQCGGGAINISHLMELQEVTDRTERFKQSKCYQIETVGHIRRNTWEEIWHDSPNINYVGDPWNVWRFFYLLFVFFHLVDANHWFLRSKNSKLERSSILIKPETNLFSDGILGVIAFRLMNSSIMLYIWILRTSISAMLIAGYFEWIWVSHHYFVHI